MPSYPHRLAAHVEGVGLIGPGLPGWRAGGAVLAGQAPYTSAATLLPAPLELPPAERRRAGRVVRLALAAGNDALAPAGVDARELPCVFSSSGGDGDNCHEICQTLAGSERLLSPTRFHNSVHNAAAGYWSIAYGCTQPFTALCAYDASFGAGLLEALCQLAAGAPRVLLICYDLDYPPPLRATRPIPAALGIALLLSGRDGPRGAQLQVELIEATAPGAPGEATTLDDAALEQLRRQIPAARGLPLLACLARGAGGRVLLDYLDDRRLAAWVLP